jgi:hypothetical protein
MGLNTTPAFLYERTKDLGDAAARIEERRGEAHVCYCKSERRESNTCRFTL